MNIRSILLIFCLALGSNYLSRLEAQGNPVPEEKNFQTSIAAHQNGGFSFKNSIEDLHFGGYLQIDGRLFIGSDQNNSTFLVRRARLFMTGTLYKYFGFMLMPRWDRLEDATLHQAWLETNQPTWAQIRLGLFKEPFSLEALSTDLYLTFVERSIFIRNFLQIEDLGAMVYGTFAHDKIEYGVGFFNGRGREFDNNKGKEVVGRIVFASFEKIANDKLSKNQMYLGFSISTGRYDECLSGHEFKTESDTAFWEWGCSSSSSIDAVEVHANRFRWGADFNWLYGPFNFRTEYLYTNWGNVRMGDISGHFFGWGAYCEISYILTGEDKPRNDAIIPKHNFDGCSHLGAFEIGAKYEIFYASQKMIDLGLACGANQVQGPTFAINWYLNPLLCIKLDGQYLRFNKRFTFHDHEMHHEAVITGRIQGIF